MRILRKLIILLAISFIHGALSAQSFQLVKDIWQGTELVGDARVHSMHPMGDSLFIMATADLDGTELWIYDGNPAHTKLLQNFTVSNGDTDADHFHVLGGKMYFVVDRYNRSELWRSDGSVAGTERVYRFNDGSEVYDAAVYNGRLLLLLRNGTAGTAAGLWASDGTSSGTSLVYAVGYLPYNVQFVEMQGGLFFASSNQVFKTDGTYPGTIARFATGLVYDLQGLVRYHDRLWFNASSFLEGHELWSCDSSLAAPVLHDDYLPGSNDGAVYGDLMFVADDRLFFLCNDYGMQHGVELRSTDGNPGNAVVYDWIVGAGDSYYSDVVAAEHFFMTTEQNSGAYLIGNAAGLQVAPLGGTVRPLSNSSMVRGDTIIYASFVHSNEIWMTDGTDAGTTPFDTTRFINHRAIAQWNDSIAIASMSYYPMAGNIYRAAWARNTATPLSPMPSTGNSSSPRGMEELNGQVFFSALDSATGRQMWVTDGTTQGTFSLGDLWPGPQGSVGYNNLAFNGELYWTDDDSIHGSELWKSDGTVAGTQMVADICPGSCPSYATPSLVTDQYLYIFAQNPATGKHATYRTDGTGAGTVLVHDDPAITTGRTWPVARLGNNVIMDSYNYNGLSYHWLSIMNGQPGNAIPLVRLNAAPDRPFWFMDNHLYFTGKDTLGIVQLWKTDGTQAGTQKLSHFAMGNFGSPEIWGMVNGRLILTYYTSSMGRELYASDGTWAGTTLIADVRPGSVTGSVDMLGADDSLLYFVGSTSPAGEELWVTDGTTSGTHLVLDLTPGAVGSSLRSGDVYNGRIFLLASQPGYGYEFLESDGTPQGTYFYDFLPGPGSGVWEFYGLTDQGAMIETHTDTMGFSLFLVDRGTVTALPDVTGDPASTEMSEIAMTANGLVLDMYTPITGRELWRLDGLSFVTGSPRLDAPAAVGAGLRAYPVPAHDRVRVAPLAPGATIVAWQLVGLNGQVQRAGNLAPEAACELDLLGLPAGLYIVRATLGDGRTAAIKVVKE